MKNSDIPFHRVVIVGGGFGGLYAAKSLGKSPVQVTLIDRRNFHLFQPLLYQVATGVLSPGEIAAPLRGILRHQKNTLTLQAEVVNIDPERKKVFFEDQSVDYDTLIIATGSSHHYFGHPEWEKFTPGLKTLEDAFRMRRKILEAFEKAECEQDPKRRQSWLNFAIVGAGPTGVELAGALAELAYSTLREDFRRVPLGDVQIYLIEGADRVLPGYPSELSEKARHQLEKLGVKVWTHSLLREIREDAIKVEKGKELKEIATHTVLWAAGVQASPLGKVLAERLSLPLDPQGRLQVEPDLSLAGAPDIFVIGDLANFSYQNGKPLPGVAPVAIQQGHYIAQSIQRRLKGKKVQAFHYFNKGSVAVIGRNAGVADLGPLQFGGFTAWLLWAAVHLAYLVEFNNKVLVLFRWAWNYLTYKRGARLIVGTSENSGAMSRAKTLAKKSS